MSCYVWRGRQRALACAANSELVLRLLSLSAESGDAGREKMSRAYKLAADSVSKCPLPITGVEEARQLVGIGDFIANRIGHWLSTGQQRPAGSGDEPEPGRQPAAALQQSHDAEQKERTRSRRFTPSRGTPAFHLLLSLVLSSAPSAAASSSSSSAPSSCPALAVLSLFSHCATTFHVAEKKQKDALRTLTDNGLLERSGGNSEGSVRLTARGLELGQQLLAKWKAAQAGSSSSSSSSSPPQPPASSSTSPSPPPPSASPPPALPLPSRHPLSGFSLTLLIDSREVAGHSHSSFSRSLQSSGLQTCSRALPIGDFAFVVTHTASGTEYTVDCIVERKRVPDLVSSVIDGRLTEQRWRMKRTGMQRRCFLIEGRDWDSAAEAAAATGAAASSSSSSSSGPSRRTLSLPGSTLDSVVSGLSVCHGYLVVRVRDSAGSVSFLRQLYGRLLREMGAEGVELTEAYSAFERRMRKRVGGEAEGSEAEAEREERRKTWGSQLRMIRGVSPLIASAVVAQHASCRNLLDAYDACDGSLWREDRLLAELQFGSRRRRLGLGLSRRIRQVLRMRLYHRDEAEQEAQQRAKEEAEEKTKRSAELQEKRERKKRERAEARLQATGAAGRERAEDDEQPAHRQLASERNARELEERTRLSMAGEEQEDGDDEENEWRPDEEKDETEEEQEVVREKGLDWQRQQREQRRRCEEQPDQRWEPSRQEEEEEEAEEEVVLLQQDEEAEQAVVEEERKVADDDVVLVADDDGDCAAALASGGRPVRKKLTAKERMQAARGEEERLRQRQPHSSRDVVELLSEEQDEGELQWWQDAGIDTVDLTAA